MFSKYGRIWHTLKYLLYKYILVKREKMILFLQLHGSFFNIVRNDKCAGTYNSSDRFEVV